MVSNPAPTAPASDDRRAKRNVVILVIAQAFLGAQMPMIFTAGGLAGQSLASNPCLATLPISLIVLGSMLTATPLSAAMQRFGRRVGFFIGATGGILGGVVAPLEGTMGKENFDGRCQDGTPKGFDCCPLDGRTRRDQR